MPRIATPSSRAKTSPATGRHSISSRTKNKTSAPAKSKKVASPRKTIEEAQVEKAIVPPPPAEALFFDAEWYLETYPDVAQAGIDAATHYRTSGFSESRQPNSYFNSKEYLAANPDLMGFDGDLFLHYIFYGAAEGRPLAP